eukprot:8459952-Pyramimonas_sp.AAC.1
MAPTAATSRCSATRLFTALPVGSLSWRPRAPCRSRSLGPPWPSWGRPRGASAPSALFRAGVASGGGLDVLT